MEVDGVLPQITRELSNPHTYMRVQLTMTDGGSPPTETFFRGAFNKTIIQFLGQQHNLEIITLAVLPTGKDFTLEALIRIPKGNTEKIAAACACAPMYGERHFDLEVMSAAPNLGQLAVNSRTFAVQHCLPTADTYL